ncbi:MAG: hypothetical protein CMH63_00900 [Nanoarchaeota archaeon]|nr:hypothetical protein [Nanoarchaeota archaeon]|tara:strand:+ start:10750 stop:12297 length:1548 start_codon:yes stop_codon:yes gene_type:complete
MKIGLISTSTFPADQGLRTLSSCLKKEGHQVKLIFLPLSENDYSSNYSQEVLQQLDSTLQDTKLIGITAMSSTSTRAMHLIQHFQNKNIPVVWGGPAPTFFPEKCIKHCNILAIGEAEDALVELADKLDQKQDVTTIQNLHIKKDGKIYKNPVRPLVHDLDLLPHPDYNIQEHLILEKNKLIQFQERHLGGMIFFQTERGCPHACSYCTNIIMKDLYKGKGNLLRTHSVDYVIEELTTLANKFPSIGSFDLRDETFTIRDLKWIKDFSQKYINSGVKIRLKCLADPATMATGFSEEKIKLLVDAGLSDIIVGIQSGSDRVNKEIYHRFITQEQLRKTSFTLNKFKNLAIMYDIITSNPYETSEDILETINLILEIPPPFYLSVNNLIFFEGTPLYNRALKEGVIKDFQDSAQNLNYWDRWQHIKLKKKNPYLNLTLNLMRGPVTKKRLGLMPRSVLKKLISPKLVNYNQKHSLPTNTAGSFVSVMDNFRENIAKPLYRSLPVNFKNWYDKIRYRA